MKKTLKVTGIVIGSLLLLLVLIIGALQFPAIQTKVTSMVADKLSKQWGTEVSVGRVNLQFFEQVNVEEVYIEDNKADTLLYAGSLTVDIGLFNLFQRKIMIDEVSLEDIVAKIKRPADGPWNYQFILDSLNSQPSDTTKQSKPWDFDLNQANLRNIRFLMDDDSADTYIYTSLSSLEGDLKTLGIESGVVEAEYLRVDGLSYRMTLPLSEPSPDTTTVAEADAIADTSVLIPGLSYLADELSITNSSFYFRQGPERASTGEMDFTYLDLQDITIKLQDIKVAGDTVAGEATKIAAYEAHSDFRLSDAAFTLNMRYPSLEGTISQLKTARSHMAGTIEVGLTDMLDPDALMQKSRAEIDWQSSHFDLEELSVFLPMLDTMPALRSRDLDISGQVVYNEGTATIQDLSLALGNALDMRLNGRASQVTDMDNLRYSLDLHHLSVSSAFLRNYMQADSLPPALMQNQRLRLNASAKGSLKRSDIKAVLRSTTGKLSADVVFRMPSEGSFSVDGLVNADEFNLRPILGDSSGFGQTTLAAEIALRSTPTSLTIDTANVQVAYLDFNDYAYKDLTVAASLEDSIANFRAEYTDSMLIFDLNGWANLAKNNEQYRLQGKVEEANLFRLNLSPDSIILKSSIDMDFRGSIPDEMTGQFVLDNTEIVKGARRYDLDTLRLFAENTDSGRLIGMRSDFVDMDLYGDYKISRMAEAFADNLHYYLSNYPSDTSKVLPNQQFVLDLHIKEEPVLAKVFLPELEIPEPLDFRFEFRMDERMIDLQLDAPRVYFAQDSIYNLRVYSTTNNKEIDFSIAAEMLNVAGLKIPNMATTGKIRRDELDFTLALADEESPNRLRLNSELFIAGDTVRVDIQSSSVFLNNERWNISQEAYVEYHPEYLLVDDFLLAKGDQSLRIFTEGGGTDPLLVAEINELGVGQFLNLFDLGEYGIEGKLNGHAEIVDPMEMKSAEANLSVDSLQMDNQPAGRLLLTASTRSPQHIETKVELVESQNEFLLAGVYNAADSLNALDFDLTMNFEDISQWSVFANEMVKEVNGGVAAELDIQGTPLTPQITGFLQLKNNLSFRPVMLGESYTIRDQKIDLTNTSINLNQIKIEDENGEIATLSGSISHENFTNFTLDNKMTAQSFTFIDKIEDDEALFYGELLANADVSITGPLDNLVVDGDFTSLSETNFTFNLPQDPATILKPDWVTYINSNAFIAEDTLAQEGQNAADYNKVDISGVRITSRIELSEGTQVNIVIDPQNNDVIRAVGEGEFIFGMDEDGQMQLQGTLVLSSGAYTLNFGGLIKREFSIREGSSITWSGDPLKAQMNLTAEYTTMASRSALINTQVDGPAGTQAQAASAEMPVDVVLGIRGSLLEPDLTFDIEVPEEESGMIGNQVVQKLESIRQNESELYRQIFGLVVLGRFLPEEGFGESDSNFANTVNARINASVSALLTAQLNRLGTDFLGGVEFDVDVTSSPYATSTAVDNRVVDLSLSRNLFNERMTVSVGGTSDIGGNAAANSNAAFLGSFTVYYRLDKDGNLTLKLYQDNDLDIFTQQVQQISGASLLYIRRFDTISNFFSGDEDDKKKDKKEEDGKDDEAIQNTETRRRQKSPVGLRKQ
ncbi:translocation/assembly module TamB domain-containing protein [Roseivirga sp. BDSF3-8]|uniref:translocation/assembly module TamB domain-containing protein n=1 Tax=Roseivirga sp. BDSF3-8 TaxID=3241598 RepID=UPI003531A879